MGKYGFYGWETADVRDVYFGLTPRDCYDLLSDVWSAETCAPRMRKEWSPENRTLGQCSITAFLMQDLFGGEVYGIPLEDGSAHCFNDVGGCIFDLTSEQFGERKLNYENCALQERDEHFAKEEKKKRYERLREEFFKTQRPVLFTDRLILRPWHETDAEECYRYARDPDVGPIAGWQAHTSVSNSREIISEVLSSPETYAIVWKRTMLPIGCVGLRFESDLAKESDECDLGYWLGKPYWGRGIMPEAVRALLRHAFEDLGMNRVWCGYYEGNERSKRVQEKCAFRYKWTTDSVDVPQMHEKRKGHVNCLTKEEWRASRMEEQIITVTIRTKGEKCELNDEEIRQWYASHIAQLFDPAYGTPEITVDVKRNEK